LEDYLGGMPTNDTSEPVRVDLFGELLALELAYRIRLGERPLHEEYERRFPSFAELVPAIFTYISSDSQSQEGTPSGPLAEEDIGASSVVDTPLIDFGRR